jgi:ATP-binding cassette subfamily G (WHITE) protein 2
MHFVPTLTVSETCAFHAALAAPSGTGGQQRQERIQLILGEIGLLHASKTLVGGMLPGGIMLRGLSGGERRRLAIAVGLLAGELGGIDVAQIHIMDM